MSIHHIYSSSVSIVWLEFHKPFFGVNLEHSPQYVDKNGEYARGFDVLRNNELRCSMCLLRINLIGECVDPHSTHSVHTLNLSIVPNNTLYI